MNTKRLATKEELDKIPKSLLKRYEKLGYVAFIDEDELEKGIQWGYESQILCEDIEKNEANNFEIPRICFWTYLEMAYSNFLWIILFIIIVVFTVFLMIYDFDIHALGKAAKELFKLYL